jgi:CBS domain-containing protein
VYEAARAMEDNRVGAVLVSHQGHLVGIVTDRDVALAVARDDFDSGTMPLEAVMTGVVGTCAEDASLADIVTTMRQFACRRVPLLRAGRPVGIVTLDDLVVAGAASPEDVAAIVSAQLELPSRLKPARALRPSSLRPADDGDSEGKTDAAHWALVRDVERLACVGSPGRAETALAIVRAELEQDHASPEAPVTLDTIALVLGDRLGIQPDATLDILLLVSDSLRDGGAEDELYAKVRGVLAAVTGG